MKFLIFLVFLIPVAGACQVGNSYRDYLHSEFADFFHTAEVKRTPYKNGELREIKMGGFHDYITIYLHTDTVSIIIHEATLEIDREWMEEDRGSELARDLVKSFLLDFISKIQISTGGFTSFAIDLPALEIANTSCLYISHSLYNSFYTHLTAKAP